MAKLIPGCSSAPVPTTVRRRRAAGHCGACENVFAHFVWYVVIGSQNARNIGSKIEANGC